MTNILDEIASTPLEGPLEPSPACTGAYFVDKEGDTPSLSSIWKKCPACMYGKPTHWIQSLMRPTEYIVVYHTWY